MLTGRGAMINGKIEPESPVGLGSERSEAGDDELSINFPHGAETDLSTLSERLKAMVRLMEMKDKLLQEKERTIQILMRGFPAECAQMDEGGINDSFHGFPEIMEWLAFCKHSAYNRFVM